jgi:outer membrane protein assembly factor BamB
LISHTRRAVYILLLAVSVLFFTAGCAPTRVGVSWPVVDTIVMNDTTRLLVAYNNIVTMIEPGNGALTRLETPEGEPRVNDDGSPRIWQLDGKEAENAQFFSRPVRLDDETLLLGAYNHRLLKVDLLTAKINTTKLITEPIIADLTATDDTVFASLMYGDVLALDRDTLEQRWQADTLDGVWSQPVVVDNVVYVASADHHLYAFSADTGKPVWSQSVDLEGLAGAAPLYADGFLYVGSYSHKVFKVNADDGSIVGSYQAHNWIWSTPVLYDGILYVTDLSGYVHAIDATTMEAVWSVKAANKGIRPSPLVTETVVVVASRDGIIHWLARDTGETLSTREIEGRPEILSDLLLLERGENLRIPETLVVVSTVNLSHLVVAFPLDYTSGYQGWVYAR